MTKVPSVRTYSCSTFYSRAVSMCVGAGAGAGWGGGGVGCGWVLYVQLHAQSSVRHIAFHR